MKLEPILQAFWLLFAFVLCIPILVLFVAGSLLYSLFVSMTAKAIMILEGR